MRDLKPRGCPFCDFSMGTRGMDRCSRCDGTGSVFLVGDREKNPHFFANTKKGYEAACAMAGIEPVSPADGGCG